MNTLNFIMYYLGLISLGHVLLILVLSILILLIKGVFSVALAYSLSLSAFTIYRFSLDKPYLIAMIPLLIPIIYYSIHKLNIEGLEAIRLRSLGPTTTMLTAMTALTSLFIVVEPYLIMLYTIYALIVILEFKNRMSSLDKLNVAIGKLELIRGETRNFTLKIVNNSKYRYILYFENYSGDEVSFSYNYSKVVIDANDRVYQDVFIYGHKIGRYVVESYIRVIDANGLINSKLRISLNIIVKPKLSEIIRLAYGLIGSTGIMGFEYGESTYTRKLEAIKASRVGEYAGCREYVPGDDPRHIHLKKSLSKGELVVKEYERIGSGVTFIMIDLSINDINDLDDVLSSALIVTMGLVEAGRVNSGLAIYSGENIIYKLPPRNTLHILKYLLSIIDRLGVDEKPFKYVFDPPYMEQLLKSSTIYAIAELKILYKKFTKSVLYELIRWVDSNSLGSAELYVICHKSRHLPIYPILKNILERRGYIVNLVFNKSSLVKAKEELTY